MISKKVNSVQEWLPVDEILENGIIKVKNKNYIKIIYKGRSSPKN